METLLGLRARAREPDTSAGQPSGTAEELGLLDEKCVQTGGLCAQRGRHSAATGTHDQNIHCEVEICFVEHGGPL